jgi:3-phosphoshikimate 1-carboxyvinyltransferase
MAAGLKNLGIQVEESADGATVHCGQFSGGEVDSHGDHRVAMSLAIAGSIAKGQVTVNDVAAVDTSFPGFTACMGQLGVDVR